MKRSTLQVLFVLLVFVALGACVAPARMASLVLRKRSSSSRFDKCFISENT
jgi:hypothetical protein